MHGSVVFFHSLSPFNIGTDSYNICTFPYKMHNDVNSADRKSIESSALLCRRGRSSLLELLTAGDVVDGGAGV